MLILTDHFYTTAASIPNISVLRFKCNFELLCYTKVDSCWSGPTAANPTVKRHNIIILSIHDSLQQKQVWKRHTFWNQLICSLRFTEKAVARAFILPQIQIKHACNLGTWKLKINQIKSAFLPGGLTDVKTDHRRHIQATWTMTVHNNCFCKLQTSNKRSGFKSPNQLVISYFLKLGKKKSVRYITCFYGLGFIGLPLLSYIIC